MGHHSPPALSLSHYSIIIQDTSLLVECFSFAFFLSRRVNIGQESIFIWALESVCALFMKTHRPRLAQLFGERCRRGGGCLCVRCRWETDLRWPLNPQGWIIDVQWHHSVVESLLVWLMFSVCVREPDIWCMFQHMNMWGCLCALIVCVLKSVLFQKTQWFKQRRVRWHHVVAFCFPFYSHNPSFP